MPDDPPLMAAKPVARCLVCGDKMLTVPTRGMIHFYAPSWDRRAAPCMGELVMISEDETNAG